MIYLSYGAHIQSYNYSMLYQSYLSSSANDFSANLCDRAQLSDSYDSYCISTNAK
jgi:hypothetical protein